MGPFDAALLASTLVIAAPLLIAALGELVSERAGVLNVGLDGMILSGAFVAFLVDVKTGSMLLGFVAGVLGGLAFAVIMASLAIDARADQIVVGIGINLLALGLTSFLNDDIFGSSPPPALTTISDLRIPLLSDLGGVGDAIFGRDPIVYLSVVLLAGVWWALYRTTWGIAVRSVGENPAAADAAGVSVRGIQWTAVLFAGACAGLAGAYLSIGELGVFRNEMTVGRGFLVIAAVMFGRWSPRGVVGAVLIFSLADALQLRLQSVPSVPAAVWYVGAAIVVVLAARHVRRSATGGRGVPAVGTLAAAAIAGGLILLGALDAHVSIPATLWLAAPFLLALVALTGARRQGAATPSALGIGYSRGER